MVVMIQVTQPYKDAQIIVLIFNGLIHTTVSVTQTLNIVTTTQRFVTMGS
jgi:hypothetical protein